MEGKIAVVTGANKGIGYAIVKELCRRGVGVCYLTARDVKRGQDAVENLKKEGYNPTFHQLEVSEPTSVKILADYLKKKHGGLDILINNAAVATDDFTKITYEDSKRVININYYSIFNIQEYIYPILKDNARVVNISSDCGHISNLQNKYWIDRLTKEDLAVTDINEFVNWFLESVKHNTLNEDDFVEMPFLAYRISKIAISAVTRVQQKQIGRDIAINSLHPGFVKTDMTKGVGNLTMDEASKTPVYLALDADQSIKGQYIWFDKSVKDWTDRNLKIYCVFANIERALRESS